jgi:hypothetical protein
VDYPDYAVNPVELKRILEYTREQDGQLRIKDNQAEVVREQVATHRGEAYKSNTSTLGISAAHVFRLLLSGVSVFIDRPISDGRRHIRAVEEHDAWWELISVAEETHVLAASITNSEFEIFAQVNGFQFLISEFTPPNNPITNKVTIFPVVPKGRIFSKRLMTERLGESRHIDVVLSHIKCRIETTPLLFSNKWAKLESVRGVKHAPIDCRGLNTYLDATEAILLFGGNPSPSESTGLEYLATKYGRDFEKAFITERLLQRSLQAATRTAIRCRDNVQPVKFYVQDYRVADYLRSTYFRAATIDWSLAATAPIKRDGRTLSPESEDNVKRLIALNLNNLQIHKMTGISRKKIRDIRNSLQLSTVVDTLARTL